MASFITSTKHWTFEQKKYIRSSKNIFNKVFPFEYQWRLSISWASNHLFVNLNIWLEYYFLTIF